MMPILQPQQPARVDPVRSGDRTLARRYDYLFENTRSLNLVLLGDGRIIDVNEAGAARLGYTKDQLIGRNALEFVVPHQQPMALNLLQRSFSGEASPSCAIDLVVPDGTRTLLFAPGQHECLHNGEHVILIGAVDIPDQRQTQDALAEARELHRAIFRSAHDALLVLDHESIIDCNEQTSAMFGGRHGQMLGLHPAMISPPRQPCGSDSETLAAHHIGEALAGRPQQFNWVHCRLDGTCFDAEVSLVKVMVANRPLVVAGVRDMTEKVAAQRKLEFVAYNDPVTKLPNRASLMREVGRLGTAGADVLLLRFDIERFELLVATLGHQYGLYVLNEMASRLSRAPWSDLGVRVDRHLPACFGSDAFALALVGRHLNPTEIADKVRRWLAEPLRVGGHDLRCTVNLGVAHRNHPRQSAADLLRDAETAHYHARQLGTGQAVEFKPSMQEAVNERVAIERDLCHALERKQLHMAFQPIVSMVDGRTIGGEALMRWNHPKRGQVSPGQFIAIAEESDLIIELGEFALREACALIHQIDGLGIADEAFWLSVNLSRRQLLVPDLPDRLLAIVREAGITPSRIKLEVTESVIMTDAGSVPPLLGRIRELGFRLAMDDFGTGQSSLSCLHQFPIDTLKIDRAFIQKVGADRQYAAVVYAIVTLAHNLGMDVVAEGIETDDQIAQLQALDCDLGQGYVFAKPIHAEAFIQTLSQQSNPPTPGPIQP